MRPPRTSPMTLQEVLARWVTDLPAYCRSALNVLDKGDRIQSLVLNPMQLALHAALERQMATQGNVRALVLKARQMGCSTYVAARFFAAMHLRPRGARAYLLAHEDDSAVKITRIYQRFWEYHAPALRRPRTRASDHELAFAHGGGLESSTASTPSGGRGGTVSLYHGSEVAFWMHAGAHATGSMQQMSTGLGTEMVLESTANGPLGAFYERYRAAEQGRGDFIALFYPWTVDPTYVRAPDPGFTLSPVPPNEVVLSEVEYADAHGCTPAQMAWRRAKCEELGADGEDGYLKFAQEYPATSDEAFLGVSGRSLLSPAAVEAARRRPTFIGALERMHPLVMGLDPAPLHGGSQSVVVYRRGSICYHIERLSLDVESLLEHVAQRYAEEGAARLCIDCSEGVGQAVYEALMRRPGTAGNCVRVVFGGKSRDKSRFYNLRAQMWSDMAVWIREGAAIPNELVVHGRNTLAMELLSVQTLPGSERVIQLESKEHVVKRLGRSPDGADALACTFALPEPTTHGGHFQATKDGPVFHGHEVPLSRAERARRDAQGHFNPLRR